MSAPLRSSVYPYTAHHIAAADRFETAVINAAGVWHDASRNLSDAENALQMAHDEGDDRLAHMLEYARDSAAMYADYAFEQVRLMVCGFAKPDSWEARADNGHRYRVTWSGPIIGQVSIVPQN